LLQIDQFVDLLIVQTNHGWWFLVSFVESDG
jgi:hypothetical protein